MYGEFCYAAAYVHLFYGLSGVERHASPHKSQIKAVHILTSSFVVIIVVSNCINNNGDIINVITNRR
jgi:hypothetical protein